MSSNLTEAIETCKNAKEAFCKFITANETGINGSHQVGFYIPKNAISILFDSPGIKGANKDRQVKIKWNDDFETTSRFIYYGVGTRNEYRITQFGRGFPFLKHGNEGNLFILAWIEEDFYKAYVLESDDEIEDFLAAFGLTTVNTNRLIQYQKEENVSLELLFQRYIAGLTVDFPFTAEVSNAARDIFAQWIKQKFDFQEASKLLLDWLNTEFSLFKAIEISRYGERIQTPFRDVEELIDFANTILNRRKSRAGKSLEHHLAEMFKLHTLPFSNQAITEDNKKPDFIFPGGEYYHQTKYPEDKLIFLGVKTTCKDRWRQVLNEADRIRTKHLFTLQQGISENQLAEMKRANVVLVVPEPYISSFPRKFQPEIQPLEKFIGHVRATCTV